MLFIATTLSSHLSKLGFPICTIIGQHIKLRSFLIYICLLSRDKRFVLLWYNVQSLEGATGHSRAFFPIFPSNFHLTVERACKYNNQKLNADLQD